MTGAPPFLSRRERALPPWGLCLGSWMSLVCGEFKKPVVWYCLVMGHISTWMGLEGTLRPQGGVGGSWVVTGGRVRPGGVRGGEGWGVARTQDPNSQPGQPCSHVCPQEKQGLLEVSGVGGVGGGLRLFLVEPLVPPYFHHPSLLCRTPGC